MQRRESSASAGRLTNRVAMLYNLNRPDVNGQLVIILSAANGIQTVEALSVAGELFKVEINDTIFRHPYIPFELRKAMRDMADAYRRRTKAEAENKAAKAAYTAAVKTVKEVSGIIPQESFQDQVLAVVRSICPNAVCVVRCDMCEQGIHMKIELTKTLATLDNASDFTFLVQDTDGNHQLIPSAAHKAQYRELIKEAPCIPVLESLASGRGRYNRTKKKLVVETNCLKAITTYSFAFGQGMTTKTVSDFKRLLEVV